MNDLVQSQIQDSCRLALPNGLKELMWDISREVLRAQPPDVCTFIFEYLLALLVTRENSAVAYSICGEVCTDACRIPLDEELKTIGFTEEDAAKAKEIVQKMFELDEVNECDILNKILELDSMNEVILPAVQDAVCKAYLIHQHPYMCKTPSDVSHLDVVDQAVHHTLRLYRNTKPSKEEYEKAAINIQAAYRAYGVRRSLERETSEQSSDGATFHEQDDFFSTSDDHDDGQYTLLSGEYFSTVHYHHEDPCDPEPSDVYKPVVRAVDSKELHVLSDHNHKPCLKTVSSTSLAGSFVHLPKFKPYTPISGILESEENAENNDGSSNDVSRKHFENKEHRISEKEINFSDYNEVLEAKVEEDSVNKLNVVHDNIAKYNVKEINNKTGSVLEEEDSFIDKYTDGDDNIEQNKISEENLEENDVE